MDRRPSECTFRALAAAHLRCSSRASRSPHGRRSLPRQRGCARPPPAATAVPRPRHARARHASRTGPHQPAAGGDGRRGGHHGHVQRPDALVHDGLRAPRAAARMAARPSRPGSGSRMSTDIGCRARSRSAAGKSVRREVRGAKVRWKCRRGPSAARCWPPWAPVQPLAAPPGAPAPAAAPKQPENRCGRASRRSAKCTECVQDRCIVEPGCM